MRKRVLFLTGTRADYGKLRPLMEAVHRDSDFECRTFVTGMHTLERYGYTVKEIRADGFGDPYVYVNQIIGEPMDLILANTIYGLSRYVHDSRPDLIVVHGDRLEALAGAIVGSFRNIPTAHIEGGELSGTIDGLVRHSVSKLAHVHFVANQDAANRLSQSGESREAIHIIGSPDIDVMLSDGLPALAEVKNHYEIGFGTYGIALFHPVTTEHESSRDSAENFVAALLRSDLNFVVIFPNNDLGTDDILHAYERLRGNSRFRILPSLRFKYFLTLLKHARLIAGNSSAGIREAPVYGVPSVDVGSRQRGRFDYESIVKVGNDAASILAGIDIALAKQACEPSVYFGRGDSALAFMRVLKDGNIWAQSTEKCLFESKSRS